MAKRIVIKLISVAGITIGLLIPLTMIHGLVEERSRFREEARNDIARSWTGAQNILGPVLTVPMSVVETVPVGKENPLAGANLESRRRQVMMPARLHITSKVTTQKRRRGLYEVPVYNTKLSIEGSFDTEALEQVLEAYPLTLFGDATLALGISDNRGIAKPPVLSWNDSSPEFVSGSALPGMSGGVRSDVGQVDPALGKPYMFKIELELRGMESLSFVPVGRETHVTMDAEWPHPSFSGRFLPVEYTIADGGFQAEWSVSHLATNPSEIIDRLIDGGDRSREIDRFGVSLITPVDIYQQGSRSVKYGSLFVLLTFTGFFVVEISRRLNFHAMQYLLVGLALVIFFLLLVALSEHIPFGWAYLIAAVACVGLVGTYLSSSVGRASSGFSIVSVLGGLYGMLYAILRSEDNALLMGSLLLFAALAAVMLVTRKLDWYKLTGQLKPEAKPPQGQAGFSHAE